MHVPLLDLKLQYASLRAEIEPLVAEIMASQLFILGPHVEACEKAVAAYSQCAFGVGVTSGTDALLICLMAEGIGPGDEVITTPYTFFATAGCIARVGAKPVFVDIDPATFNLDVGRIEAAITPRTKAIMPVHLYGQMVDMEALMVLAGRHHLVVIEDAAQAIGSARKGRRAGSIGHYGCFSFFPSKNLGCFGDGGLVTTNEPARAEKLKCLRNHGMNPKYYHRLIGGNFRLDALQAAVVNVKLKYLDGWTEGRQRNALRYHRLFAEAGLADRVVQVPKLPKSLTPEAGAPATACACRHIVNQYVIRVPRRDDLLKHLQKEGIGCEIYYPVPLHLQDCFRDLGHKTGDFPESERAAKETLALPIFPELTEAQQDAVVEAVRSFYA